jgi:hypothetical protein
MAGTSFLPAKRDVIEVVDQVKREYHPELEQAGVTVNVLMAFGDLKLHGDPCAATVKINSTQQRIEGLADATVKLHSETWRDLTDRERIAVVDHELHHLKVAVEGYREEKVPLGLPDQPDAVKVVRHLIFAADDAGRPKLKMRRHDLVVGGFRASAYTALAVLEREHLVQLADVDGPARYTAT